MGPEKRDLRLEIRITRNRQSHTARADESRSLFRVDSEYL